MNKEKSNNISFFPIPSKENTQPLEVEAAQQYIRSLLEKGDGLADLANAENSKRLMTSIMLILNNLPEEERELIGKRATQVNNAFLENLTRRNNELLRAAQEGRIVAGRKDT